MIKLVHVSKSFNNTDYIVRDICLEVKTGETLVLLGSSGSGKTTIMKMINRLIEPTTGDIEVNGVNNQKIDPVQLRRSIGYVFQGIGLFPHLTVEENTAIVLQIKNTLPAHHLKLAHQALSLVNLDPALYGKRYPFELSGGQQQRVGVARALVTGADILLMDEPFAALDTINRHALQNELVELKKKLHKTIIFVTHDIFEALRLGDRIAVIHNGKIEQVGCRKTILQRPATRFVQQLFQQMQQQLKDYKGLLSGIF